MLYVRTTEEPYRVHGRGCVVAKNGGPAGRVGPSSRALSANVDSMAAAAEVSQLQGYYKRGRSSGNEMILGSRGHDVRPYTKLKILCDLFTLAEANFF